MRGWKVSVEGQILNSLGFVDHVIFVAATQICYCKVKAAMTIQKWTKGNFIQNFISKFYLWKQKVGQFGSVAVVGQPFHCAIKSKICNIFILDSSQSAQQYISSILICQISIEWILMFQAKLNETINLIWGQIMKLFLSKLVILNTFRPIQKLHRYCNEFPILHLN